MFFALVFGFVAGLVVEWRLGWARVAADWVVTQLAKFGIDA